MRKATMLQGKITTNLATGIAGLLAGALSMAAGEYVSVRSQREMFEYQIGLERDELRLEYQPIVDVTTLETAKARTPRG